MKFLQKWAIGRFIKKIENSKIEVSRVEELLDKLQELVKRANVNGDGYIDYKDIIAETKNRLKELL